MPYEGEYADKSMHAGVVNNPNVRAFLEQCSYLRQPSQAESDRMVEPFRPVGPLDGVTLPGRVVAIDGSYYEAGITDRLPHTRVGYVRVGTVLIDMEEYRNLRVLGGRYVDPFRVAEMERGNDALAFTLPSANVRFEQRRTVREGFRAAVDRALYDTPTRFVPADPGTSLRTTLFRLAMRRPDVAGASPRHGLTLHRCPSCQESISTFQLPDVSTPQHCPQCGDEVFPADCLRVWEEVTEYQPNAEAISRFMSAVEHMLTVHYIRHLILKSEAALPEIAFVVDGPLAVFGNAAWLHGSIMRYLHDVNAKREAAGRPRVLVLGIQKTGQLVDFFAMIDRYVPSGSLCLVEDDYRYTFVQSGREPPGNGFGAETYYGQDFLYKTASGRRFVFSLPFPFPAKGASTGFAAGKSNLGRYSELDRALALIRHFESDLYENAVVPVALAHRYTSISAVPGGKVLDLLTRRSLGT